MSVPPDDCGCGDAWTVPETGEVVYCYEGWGHSQSLHRDQTGQHTWVHWLPEQHGGVKPWGGSVPGLLEGQTDG